jgi:lysozyme
VAFSSRLIFLALALGAGAFAACSSASSEQTVQDRAYDEQDVSPDGGDAGPPRRQCPSASKPDGGGWVEVDGIDTSDYEFVDWDEVVAQQPNIGYAFLRVAASVLRVDSRFHADWPEAKRVGLVRGVYQFLSPRFSANAQADLFLQRLHDEGGLEATDLPPVLDVETTNNLPTDVVTCKIKVWLNKVETALGRVPMIYSSQPFTAEFGPEMKRYPLWVANYVATPSVTCPRMPDAWDKWAIWQYSEDSTVKGVYSNADRDGGGSKATDDAGAPVLAGSDMNYLDGTRADLDALVANSFSTGSVPGAPLPANPTPVPTPDGGTAPDCTDGCCVNLGLPPQPPPAVVPSAPH